MFFFLQKRECCTGLDILETVICTKEHRGLEHQAALSCPRSQPHYTADAAATVKKQVFN